MAAALTQEQLLDVIRIVFGQYRRRLANVSALAGIPEPLDQAPRSASFQAEQHVLIGCALDAMAGDWATVVRPDLSGPGQASGNRMQEFLATHANSTGIFNKVAAPMLVDQLVKDGEHDAAHVLREVVHDRRTGIVRFADEDPDYAVISVDPRITALRINATKPNKLKRELPLRRYRFGEVLYADHRCGWAHNFRPSQRLAPSDVNDMMGWGEYDRRVRYQNISSLRGEGEAVQWVKLRRPVFSVRWLLDIYNEALHSFEQQCITEQRDLHPLFRD